MEKEHFPNHFVRLNYLITKPTKDITGKENYRPIALMNIDKKLPQKLHCIQVRLTLRIQVNLTFKKNLPM